MKEYIYCWLKAFLLIFACCFIYGYYQMAMFGHTTTYTPPIDGADRTELIKDLTEQLNRASKKVYEAEKSVEHFIDAIEKKQQEFARKKDELDALKSYDPRRYFVIREMEKIAIDLDDLKAKRDKVQGDLIAAKDEVLSIKTQIEILGGKVYRDLFARETFIHILRDSLRVSSLSLLAIWVGRVIWKVILYYLLAPFIARFRIKLNQDDTHADFESFKPEQHFSLNAAAGHSILIKNQDYINKYAPENCRKKTVWLFSWKHPIMSWLEDLTVLTRFIPESPAQSVSVDITHSDPTIYFTTIKLSSHPVYITPASIVAYSGSMKLKAIWSNLFNPAAWVMGRVRFYTATGDGILVIQGHGKLVNHTLTDSMVLKMDSLAAAHSHLRFGVKPNETFIPYLLGQANLFDLKLSGKGQAIQTTAMPSSSIMAKFRDSALAILGKFLGF